MNLDSLVVALEDTWAAEHGLPKSVFRFPWDPETKGVYFLKVYHGLHCLVSSLPCKGHHEELISSAEKFAQSVHRL